jgi:hypothetical protein
MRSVRSSRWLRGTTVVCLVAAGLLGTATRASATTVGDEAALRAAVNDTSESSISLSADVDLTCGGGGALVRNSATALTITGNSHWISQTCAGDDAIQVTGTGGLTLSGIALTGTVVGDTSPLTVLGTLILGGPEHAIDTGTGPVDVSGSYIFDGPVDGIHSSGGSVTLTDSAMGSGGSGIISDGDVTLVRSEIRFVGGDGLVGRARNTIINSTIALSRGNGIVAGGPTSLVYASIVDNGYVSGPNDANLAFDGGGGSYVLQNTLVSRRGSGAVANCQPGPTVSHGYNFSDDSTCGLTEPTDHPDGGDPMVAEQAFPPGSLFSAYVPQPGSPLINAIPFAACQAGAAAGITIDVFGNPRPGPNGGCDIGAFQTETVPAPAPSPPVVITPMFTG